MEAQILRFLARHGRKVLPVLVVSGLLVIGLFGTPQNQLVQALQTGPSACDTFTVDGVDYVLGFPPPLAVWEPTNGTWVIANDSGEDVLHQTDALAGAPADPINLMVGPGDLDDAVFAAEVKFLSGSMNAGIVFRAQDHDNLYLFRLSASTAELFKRVSGTYTSLGSVPFAPAPNTWYTLRIDAIGSNFRAFIDDVFMLSATDSTFSSGKVGLRTHATEAYFDNTCAGVGPFTWDVDDDGVQCPNPEFTIVQDAIDFAAEGDTVHVCAGTYPELLTISKPVKVSGDGITSIIQFPPSWARALDPLKTIFHGGVDTQADPLVWVENVEDATVEKLFLDGNNDLMNPPTAVSVGVVYKNARGVVQNNSVSNFENPACLSCDTGFGAWSEGQDADLIAQNNTLTDIQRSHVVAKFGGLKAVGNTLTGRGPTATTPQNGIELSDSASGLLLNNTISGFNYTPLGTESMGIWVVGADPNLTLSGNRLTSNEIGIYLDGSNNGRLISSTVSGSLIEDIYLGNATGWLVTLNRLTGSGGQGLVLENVSNSQIHLNQISGTTKQGILLRATGGNGADNNSFIQNTVSGSKLDDVLLSMDGTIGNSMAGNSFISNTFQTSLKNGILFTAAGSNEFTNTTLKANSIRNNKNNGILLRKSTGATIEFNQVMGNKFQGILLQNKSNNTTVGKNTVLMNKRHGIALVGNSDNNTFSLNTSKMNGNGVTFFDLFWDENPAATGNSATLNFFTTEKPAYFWN